MKINFEDVDQEGLEFLENEQFIEYKDMVFRKSSYDREAIDALLSRSVPKATIQLQLNHQSLITYGSDIAQQKNAAGAIQMAWQQRLLERFPRLYPWVSVEFSPEEVIISLRVVVR
jgi:hypothetical protein